MYEQEWNKMIMWGVMLITLHKIITDNQWLEIRMKSGEGTLLSSCNGRPNNTKIILTLNITVGCL